MCFLLQTTRHGNTKRSNTCDKKKKKREATHTNSDPTNFGTSIHDIQNERGKDTDYDMQYVV